MRNRIFMSRKYKKLIAQNVALYARRCNIFEWLAVDTKISFKTGHGSFIPGDQMALRCTRTGQQ
jgi:hypothetical protein